MTNQNTEFKKKNDQPIRIRGNRERVLRAGRNLGYDPDQLQRLSVNKSEREENTLYSLLTEASFPWGTQCSVRQSKMCWEKGKSQLYVILILTG